MKPSFVLDASVSAGWIFKDQSSDYCTGVLKALASSSCVAPSLWRLEMATILLTAERKGKFSRLDSERAVHALSSLPIETIGDEDSPYFGSVRDLGREFSLSAYDAVYLELSLRLGLPLATRDEALATAVRKAGSEVYR